jgi:hypothetical protein
MKTKPITMRFDPAMLEKLEKDAQENYRTLPGQVMMIIDAYYKTRRN